MCEIYKESFFFSSNKETRFDGARASLVSSFKATVCNLERAEIATIF